MEFLLPQPDAEGIAQTQELYLRKYGRTLTPDEAAEALGKVMRYLFLVNNPSGSTPMTADPSGSNALRAHSSLTQLSIAHSLDAVFGDVDLGNVDRVESNRSSNNHPPSNHPPKPFNPPQPINSLF